MSEKWFADVQGEICMVQDGQVVVVASVNPLADLTDDDERKCGHLLAAAPDLLEALQETERRLTQALGIIVEFGDLNGFRNLSDQELGRAVIQMATAGSATLDQARAAILKATRNV